MDAPATVTRLRRRRDRGQGALEYGIAAALIAVVALVGVRFAGGSTAAAICEASQGLSANWCQLHPTTSPTARDSGMLALDPVSGHLLLFGGQDWNGNPLSDTWQWTGSNWVQLSPSNVPPARSQGTLALDPQTNRLMLYGGCTSSSIIGDQWEWTGSNWNPITPSGATPGTRCEAQMAVDPATNRLILFGGWGTSGSTSNGPLGDTWGWNGTTSTWTQLATTAPVPDYDGSLIVDPTQPTKLFLFAGCATPCGTESAVWDGTTNTWTALGTSPQLPSRFAEGMAIDPQQNEVLFFGGGQCVWTGTCGSYSYFNDTYLWTTNKPTRSTVVAATTPAPRQGPMMAVDPVTHHILLFGGQGAQEYGDTWTLQ